MPNYTGVSIKGLQKCGFSVRPDDGTTSIDFTGASRPDRLERVGTLLICQEIGSPTNFRVMAVHKLFGGGVATPTLPIVNKFNLQTHIWVVWFRAGLQWTVGTF